MACTTKLRLEVRVKIAGAGFPYSTRSRIEDILYQSIVQYRLYRRRKRLNISLPQAATSINVTPLKRGPKNFYEERMYLIAQIHLAWVVGFGEYPSINNKKYPDTPFVVFAESILLRQRVARIRNNLEEFRSYRIKQMKASGFNVVRGRVK